MKLSWPGRVSRAWSDWRKGSFDKRVALAVIVVGAATLLVKVAAVAKEMVVAARLGTGPAVDAYALAYGVIAWGETVGALAFAHALVPAWLKQREEGGEAAAARLLGQAVTILLAGLAVMTALLAAAAIRLLPSLAHGLEGGRLELTRHAVLLMLPFLIPIGLYHCWAAVLNAKERFAFAALAPMLSPLAILAAVMMIPVERGTTALAVGTVAGAVLQAAALATILVGKGFGLRPRRPVFSDPALRDVLDRFAPLLLAHAIIGLSVVVDSVMAASLGPGSNAVLQFGLRVPAALSGLGVIALGAAVLPYSSVMAARRDWGLLRRSVDRWALALLALTVPLAIAVAALSGPLTRLLFQRGEFTPDDTAMVAPVLAVGALQVPPYVLNALLSRVLIAIGGHRLVLGQAVFFLGANILGNWLLMRRFGVAGITLATALVLILSCAFMWWAIRRRTRAS